MKRRLTIPVVLLALSLAAVCARGSTIVWTNANGGNWSATSNWNPNQVPGSFDTAIITNSGNYSVMLDVSTNVGGFVLGGSDSTTQTFLLNGQTLALTGQATVNSNGVMVLDSGTLNFTNAIFNNYGTVNWSNSDLYCAYGDATFNNYGLWDSKTNGTFWNTAPFQGQAEFINYGTFRKSGGLGATTFDSSANLPFIFENSGTVDVESGTLLFQNAIGESLNGGDNGTFNIASGARISLGGAYLFRGSTTFTGNGTILGNVECGSINDPIFNGTVTFSGVTFSGEHLTITSNAVVNFIGAYGSSAFNNLALINYGTVNWSNTDLSGGCVITNYGLWDAKTNNTISGITFNNYGTLRKSGGTQTSPNFATTLDKNTTFNNTGIVDIQIGALSLYQGTGSGVFNTVANGSMASDGLILCFNYAFAGDSTFTGSGKVAGNVITGNNAVIHGSMLLGSGSLYGAFTIASNATFILDGYAESPNFIGTLFTNYGTVNWTNTDLNGSSNPQIYNYGLWDAQTNNNFNGGSSGGATTFNNYGTFRKSGGTWSPSAAYFTTLDNNTTFNNYGVVDTEVGILLINGGGTSTGGSVFNIASNAHLGVEYLALTNDVTFTGDGWIGGGLTGANAVIHGVATVNYGTLAGKLTIASNSVLCLSPTPPQNGFEQPIGFLGTIFTNYGTVIWTNSDFDGNSSPQIYNYGLWDATGNNTFYGRHTILGEVTSGTTTFNNYGTFRKSGGTLADSPTVSMFDSFTFFNNEGIVDVESGGLDFVYGSDSGVFTNAADAFSNPGNFILTGNPVFVGAGSVSASFTGNNAVVHGVEKFTGTLSGVITLAADNTLNTSPGYINFNNHLVLTNYGTFMWTNTDLFCLTSTKIYNYGLWDAQMNNTFYGAFNGNSGGGTTSFNNFGTFRKSGGALPGKSALDTNTIFHNFGTLDVQTGLLALNGPHLLAGGTLNFGINSLNNFGSIFLKGAAPFTGTLSANLNNGYSPAGGKSFPVVTYGSETGAFNSLALPLLPPVLSWQTDYGSTAFTLRVAGVLSAKLPWVQVTYPTNGMVTTNAAFTFRGVARDNISVSNVLYSFNGGAWTNAATGDNWSDWNAQVTLIPGTNKFQVYAVDTSGNVSATNNAIVFYKVPVPLGLAVVGKGMINGATNGQLFAIGRIVTLTTSNGVGYALTNWLVTVDGVPVITTNKAVPFPMASNTMVTATFADVQKPVVTLTFPTNTVTTTNTTITVSGKAKDNTGVAAVYYSVAGSGWSLATTLNNWTNWTVPNLPLGLGTNIVQIYASDTFGLNSAVVMVNVVRKPVPALKTIYANSAFHNPQAQIAFDGNNYMVAFQTETNGSGIPTAQLVTPMGDAAAAQMQIPVAGGADPPALVFDGTNYLIAWNQNDSTIYGQYLDTGSALINSPFQISESSTVDSFGTMVFGGGVYFLMWSDSSGAGSDDIYGATFSADGTFGSGDFLIGNGGSENLAGGPTAAFDGTNFLATWGGANGKYSVLGELVSPSGVAVTDPFVIYTNSAYPAGPTLQSVVYDGSKYLVMFSVGAGSGIATNWHNQGRFVMTDGTVLTNKVTFTTDVGPQIVPGGTFDGTRYLVTWNQGFNPFNKLSVGSILGRFFDVNGKPTSAEFTLFSPAAGQTALWAPVLYDGTQYFSVGGFGHPLSPAPNLTYTNGVIKNAIFAP